MRLIDADKLPYSTVYPADGDTMRSTQAVYASDIRKAPTVDMKQGNWIECYADGSIMFEGKAIQYDYCPICGAKMK